jgi:hypothetical protein
MTPPWERMLHHKLAVNVDRMDDVNELRLVIHDLRDFASDLVDTLNLLAAHRSNCIEPTKKGHA